MCVYHFSSFSCYLTINVQPRIWKSHRWFQWNSVFQTARFIQKLSCLPRNMFLSKYIWKYIYILTLYKQFPTIMRFTKLANINIEVTYCRDLHFHFQIKLTSKTNSVTSETSELTSILCWLSSSFFCPIPLPRSYDLQIRGKSVPSGSSVTL